MNLNQAAHGDREFGYIQSRLGVARKTVAGHAADPRWSRASTAGSARPRGARAPDVLRLARFGDNMRDVAVTEGDKVEAELRFGVSVNTYGVNDLVARRRRGRRRRRRRAGRRVRRQLPAGRPSWPAAASGTSRCATPPGSRSACGSSSPSGGFGAFTTNFQDLGGLRQLPGLAVQRLMADGYGFGGEGDWKTVGAARRRQGDGRRARPAAPRSWRTTPTTSARASRRSSVRTCSRSARASPPATPSCEIHPLGIGDREDPVRLVFDAAPGPAVVVGMADLGDRFRLVANEIEVVAAGRAAAQAAGRAGGLEARARPVHLRRVLADRRRPAPHGAHPGASAPRRCATSPRWCAPNSWSSTPTRRRATSPTRSAGTRPTTGWPTA